MRNPKQKGKQAMTIAIYILLITWIILLVLLIAIYMLRLQGYNSFTEWKNRNQTVEVLQPVVVTPPLQYVSDEITNPTGTPEEEIIEITVSPTMVPQGEVYSGQEAVDVRIREEAERFFEKDEEICYIDYKVGIFYSIVFQRENVLLPLVYDLTTGAQVNGSDLIKETYFAIIKERLQSYVAEKFPETASSEFASYEETYQAEDYQKFYLTEEQLVFYFEENTLTKNQPAFSYGADLSEAKAFFYKNTEGKQTGLPIRKLNPDAPMIALTFDDGPHPKVEEKLLELLDEQEVKATFFLLGQRIEEWYPDMPEKIYKAGHEVASHTYSHTLDFARVSAKEMWSEINRTNLLIANATGYAPDYVRFPGGTDGKKTVQIPMVVVSWNMDSIDYLEKKKANGGQIIFDRLKNSKYLEDGSIVLLHSIYDNSYEGVAKLIPYLKEQGYEFVTMTELFYYKGFTPDTGISYYTGFGATELEKR